MYPPSVDGHTGCFHLLAAVNNAVMNTNKSLLAEYKFNRQSMVYYGSTCAKKLIVKSTTSEKINNEMELDFI